MQSLIKPMKNFVQQWKLSTNKRKKLQIVFIMQNTFRMPISIDEKMDRFKMFELQLLKGDLLYMFSDGYMDQFGGSRGKKFMSSKLKNCFLQIAIDQ